MFKSAPRLSPLTLLPLCLLLFSCSTQQKAPLLVMPAGRHGLVHGGQQPVTGATIQLYAVGTTGDGSASTPLLSPAAVTDANGTFNITGTYTCPSPSSLVYIVASGGNPGLAPGTNNAALFMMAALGPCGNLSASTFIFINELTTVAAVYALAPYMTSPSAIGSAPADAAALASAFTLASYFANTTTGATPGTGVPAGTVVPVAQINTIGDILSTCINSAGGVSGDATVCGTLFSLTTPTGITPATDTITALLHLADNPSLNTAALYNLVTPTAPYQPVQPQTPPDLSVRLTVPSGFTASTSELDFPPTRAPVSSAPGSGPQTVTFTNNTAVPVGIDITSILSESTISGADRYDFRIANPTSCTTPVLPGATCSISLNFIPLATGPRSAYLVVNNSSSNPVIWILLTGVGLEANAGQASLSPTSLNFTASGSPLTTTLTNSGASALTIDGISISSDPTSGQPAFTQTNNCGTSLAPTSTCTITVTALSTTQPYSTGVLTVASDSAYGPQTTSLSYSNGFSGPVLFNYGSRSIGTQGAGPLDFEPPGYPSGTDTLTLTGPDATDFSFLSGSSSQSTSCTVSRFSPFCGPIIYFTPSALGTRTVTLNVNGVPYAGLIGVGLSPGLHFSLLDAFGHPLSPNSLDLGQVQIGQTSPATGLSIVNTGTVPITFNAPAFTGPNPSDFTAVSTCTTLAPNGTCGINITASPTQPTNRFATLTVTESTATMQQSVSLRALGQNPGPVANPATFAFGYTLLGTTSPPQSFTVTGFNNDPITVQAADSSGQVVDGSPFVVTQGSSCSSTPCTVSVVFAPTTANTSPNDFYNASGAIVISDLFSSQVTLVPLSGLHDLATPPPPTTVSVDQNSLTFDPQTVGSISSGQALTLTNTGNQIADIAILITGANPGDFALSNFCTQVNPGSQCNFFIQFSPTATGTRTANVQIISNNIFSPNLISLTGTGQ